MDASSFRSLIPFSSFVLVWASSATATPAQQNERLSAPFPSIPTSVPAFWTGPGTTDVFYRADQLLDGIESPVVFRAAADGSGSSSVAARPDWSSYADVLAVAPGGDHIVVQKIELFGVLDDYYYGVTLSAWQTEGATSVVLFEQQGEYVDATEFRISPDGAQVVFLVQEVSFFGGRLFGVPIDRSSPVKLLDYAYTFVITPDGLRAVYASWNAQNELRSVPVDDSQPPLTLAVLGNTDFSDFVSEIQITPDGSRALYLASSGLFSVPLDASAPPVQLNGPLVSGGLVSAFQISPDGTRAVYLADQQVNGRVELFEVPVDGSGRARRLSGSLIAAGDVQSDFRISGDGKYVVYRADPSADEVFELYSAALGRIPRVRAIGGTASSPPRSSKLSAPLVAGGDVLSFLISPDGSRVAYRADGLQNERFELFGVPLDGSATAVPVSGTLVSNGDVQPEFVFSADGRYVAYRADPHEDEVFELFGAPSDGSAAPWRLSKPMVTGGDVQSDLATSSDGARVFYRADQAPDEAFELYSVPFVRFADGEAGGHSRDASGIHGGGQALAHATRVNDDLDAIERGDVREFQIALDSAHVLYRHSGDLDLYSVDVTRPQEALRLNPSVWSYSFTRDSTRALYRAADSAGSELFSVPVDGSASPIKLNGTLPANGRVSSAVPASLGRALYIADQVQYGRFELYSVPVDRSLAPVKLNGALPQDWFVSGVRVPASGIRAAFLVSTNSVNTLSVALFGVPIDGSESAVQLSPPLPPLRYIQSGGVEIDPGGTRVVYVANPDSRTEIYSVPSDGSAGAVKLNTTPVTGGNVASAGGKWFEISPDGSRVLYLADQDTDQVFELYTVPIDGSAPPTKLNPVLVAGGDVVSLGFGPDGTRVAYVADQDSNGVFELYSVPSDGSVPAVKLNGPLVYPGVAGSGSSPAFVFTSDGSQVVYRASQAVFSRFDLYSVPSAGGAVPVKVNAPATSTSRFFIRPGASSVLYTLTTERRLFLAPLDASSAPVDVSGPITAGGSIGDIVLSPDGSFVVYRADQLVDERFELFRTLLP